jgi:hypothetical protein
MAYDNGTGRTAGILNGLGIAAAPDTGALPANPAGSPKPDANQPGNQVVNTSPNNQSPQVGKGSKKVPKARGLAIGILRAVGSGKIPGISIPVDAPKLDTGIKPHDLAKHGVGFYRPKTKTIAGVMFHPKTVPVSTLQKLDSAGTLPKAFPSIMRFIGAGMAPGASKPSGKGKSGVGTPGSDTSIPGAAGPAGASTNTPQTGAGMGQSGRNTPSISDLNLTGTPRPVANPVPVLPRPGATAGANSQLAIKRSNALGPTPPSQQSRPGAGSIVSGLYQAPI